MFVCVSKLSENYTYHWIPWTPDGGDLRLTEVIVHAFFFLEKMTLHNDFRLLFRFGNTTVLLDKTEVVNDAHHNRPLDHAP